MENLVEVVPKIVAAAPSKRIVGKIRLQKIFYLLDQLGLREDLNYSYHHYGPYCEELSTAIESAKHFIPSFDEESKTAETHGGSFSIFTSTAELSSDVILGEIELPRLESLLKKMTSTTSVVIELAATIHWLQNAEKVEDWEKTLKARKPSKTSPENISKAQDLLADLGFAA